MAGQLGNVYCTVQNQKIIKVDLKYGILLIKGALPGAPGSKVIIIQSNKNARRTSNGARY